MNREHDPFAAPDWIQLRDQQRALASDKSHGTIGGDPDRVEQMICDAQQEALHEDLTQSRDPEVIELLRKHEILKWCKR